MDHVLSLSDARAAEERIEKAKKDRAIEQRRWVNDVLGDEVRS